MNSKEPVHSLVVHYTLLFCRVTERSKENYMDSKEPGHSLVTHYIITLIYAG